VAALAALAVGASRRRRRRAAPLALVLAAGVFVGLACSSDLTVPAASPDAAAEASPETSPPETPGLSPFGATCASDSGCDSGLCATFGDGTSHCSVTCTDAATCPEGSQGRKCNGKGACAY
jgi:hypothetical protein